MFWYGENIFKELEVVPVKNKLAKFKQKWLNNVNRIKDIRHPKQILTINLLEQIDLDNQWLQSRG